MAAELGGVDGCRSAVWNVNGGVHVYSRTAYNYWILWQHGNGLGGDRICNRSGDGLDLFPRTRTLTGGFATEEFGYSLAVADFTCDGFDDLAVGAPGADLPISEEEVIEDAGAVHIFRGGPLGLGNEGHITLTQGMFGSEGEPEEGDRFGEVLTVGNFNGRRVDADVPWSCWDLAVGTPNEDDEAGEVQLFFGDSTSPGGTGPILRVGEGGLPGVRNAGDRFGASLVGFRFDDGGFHDLAIGTPGDGGGRVHIIPGSSSGLLLEDAASFGQGTSIIPDDDDPDDELGAAIGMAFVDGDRAIVAGAPGEDAGTGAITLITVVVDEGSNSFVAKGIATTIRPNEVGVTAPPGTRWGAVIGAPRAFPTRPTTVF